MTFLSQPSSAHLLAVLVVGVVSALSSNSNSNSNSNIITSRRQLYNWSRNNNNNYNNNGGSTTESIRPAACVALAVEPNDNAESQDFAANSLTVVEERSYMYYYYKGSYYDTSEPYIIDFSNFLGAFSAVYGMEDITSCQSLSSYSSDVFGSSTYANVVGSYDLYWGPLCNKGGKSLAMGVFGDDQCTQYLPELSNTLDAYLYNNNKNDDVPSDIKTYHDQVLAVNKAFQYDIGCAEGSWGGNICPTIFSSSMDTSSCQVMYDNSNSNNDNNNGGRKLEEDAADAAEEDNNNADDADAADDETESETASAAEYQLTQDDLADGQSACYAAVNAANSGSSLYDHLSALGLDVASASNKNKNGGGASKAVKVISILIVLLLLGAAALYLMKRIKRKGGPSRRSRDKSKKEPLVKVDENDNIQDPYVVVTDDGAASTSGAAGRDDQLMEDEEVDAEQTPRSNKKKRRFLGFLRKQ